MKNTRILGTVFLFITAFIWGSSFAFQRIGMEHIGPLTFMASRCVLAVIFLGFLLLVIKGPKKAFVFNRATIKGGLICGAVLTLANNLQQIGMVTTDAGKASFITAMYILLVPLASWVLFKKRQSSVVIAAALIGAVGLFLLCVGGDFSIETGDIWIMACSVGFTGHIICTDRFASEADPFQLSFLQFSVASVLSWAVALMFEVPEWTGIYEARFSIFYCGVLSAGIAYTLQIIGQKFCEPAAASLIMSLESVFGALGGALLLNETMTARELTGCGIMFFAILLVEFRQTDFAMRNKERYLRKKENKVKIKSEGRRNG